MNLWIRKKRTPSGSWRQTAPEAHETALHSCAKPARKATKQVAGPSLALPSHRANVGPEAR